MRTLAAVAITSLLGSITLACGSASGSSPFEAPAAKPSDDAGAPPVTPQLTLPASATDAGPAAACATSSASAAPIPVSLVFIFDKSGSMADDSKWPSCQTGLTSFFGDAKSDGLSASLQFFPSADECTVSEYQTPAVSMRALPDSTDFAKAMSATSPLGWTPTLPALQGSLAYAQQIQAQNPGNKVAIVLVTDGQPNTCGSTIDAVSAEAKTGLSASIPTYVIGVGDTGNLDAIALAGGTTNATIVSTTSPAQTAQDFQTALETIRGQTLSCDYKIPVLPAGDTLNQVNVVYTPTTGAPVTLTYDADCTGTNGWHYDNVANPTEISLCKSTCDGVQGGKVDLVFGCATQGNIPH